MTRRSRFRSGFVPSSRIRAKKRPLQGGVLEVDSRVLARGGPVPGRETAKSGNLSKKHRLPLPDRNFMLSFEHHIAKRSPLSGGLFLFWGSSRSLRLATGSLPTSTAATPRLEWDPPGAGRWARPWSNPLTEPAPPRKLGIIEAITAVRDQCPHAHVREHARQALEAVRVGGAEAFAEQAFLVLATLAGWRGERADQVKRSLEEFIASTHE